jgi:hypothetical protein
MTTSAGARFVLPLAAAAVAACLVAGGSHAARVPRTVTVYSIATREQFMNHSDDRSRGQGNNPFAGFKDTSTPTGTETNGNGPFAGDRSIFDFALFGNRHMTRTVGSASFVCEYVLDKNAFCSVAYKLPGGTLIGNGYFNFNATKFAVSIVGGTGKYADARGQLTADPAVKKLQKITVTFD